MSARVLVLLALTALVLTSALSVAYARHRHRQLFVEFSRLAREQEELEIEFGRLQLEQATWTETGRIERIARERLHMHPPGEDEVRVLAP